MTRRSKRAARGAAMIVVMVLVVVMATLVLSFGRAMRVEAVSSANYVSSVQADFVAQGAARAVLTVGVSAPADAVEIGGSASISGGGSMFARGREAGGVYWIIRPSFDDDRQHEFGLIDEAAKINLNTATHDMLIKLPGVTDDIAAAIIDWRDNDSEVSANGAESEHYLLKPEPYEAKNDRFETVEELLLVRGVTPLVLYGEDFNRNGAMDPNENDADESDPPDNSDGKLDRGLYDFVTTYSMEPNVGANGQPRLDVNRARTSELRNALEQALDADRVDIVADNIRNHRPYRNLIDLYYKAELTVEDLDRVFDLLTTSRGRTIEGRVNVNTAPRQVLTALPDLEEADADALIAARSGRSGDDTTTADALGGTGSAPGGSSGTATFAVPDSSGIAWITQALSQEKAIAIGDVITGRGFQYSADIVAVSRDGRAFRRYRMVMDVSDGTPRQVSWRNLTALGWPMLDDSRQSLGAGVPVEQLRQSVSSGRMR